MWFLVDGFTLCNAIDIIYSVRVWSGCYWLTIKYIYSVQFVCLFERITEIERSTCTACVYLHCCRIQRNSTK